MDASIRLRRHADYQQMYKSGRKHHAKHMSYFVAARKPAAEDAPAHLAHIHSHVGPRVGLTVGRVLGNAVVRNRIKRRLRAAVRAHIAVLDAHNIDVALHPRKAVLDLDWAVLESEVGLVFRTIAKMQAR